MSYDLFKILLEQQTGLKFILEYRFHEKRKWRFDFANLENKLAIEIEGGIYTRPKGFINDIEKYNTATAMGWKVFRCTTDNLSGVFWYLDVLKGSKINYSVTFKTNTGQILA